MKKHALILVIAALLLFTGLARSDAPAAGNPALQIVEQDGVKHFGPAWVLKQKGVYLLHVEGTDYEMAYQHGVLLREEIHQGMFAYMAGYFRREIEHSMIGGSPALVNLAEGFMNAAVFDRVAARIPEAGQEALRGLADGAGYPLAALRRLMVFADSAQVIEGMVYGRQKIFPALAPLAAFACSSFAASGPATKDGHLIHGRNLDFPGQGWFDRFPTVVFAKPQTGPRYVMFSTAGMHTAGVTGLNESGLSLGIHTAVTADVGLDGWPVMALGEKVIREAATLEEAVALLKKNLPAAGWIVMISDRKTGQAVVVELSRHHAEVIPMKNNLLATSNSYRSPVMREKEISVNWSYPVNSLSRLKRMNQLLAENSGRIDPPTGAQFLGDHGDVNTGQERATGDVIAQYHNIQSVVVDVTAGNFWIALGPAPVCNSRYVGFNFEDGFTGHFRELPALAGRWENDPRLAGLHLYISANLKYSWEDQPELAAADLRSALEIDPGEPLYAELLGLLQIKAGRPAEAVPRFKQALALPQTAYKQGLGHLWLGRAYDLLGQRAEARAEYQKVLPLTPVDERIQTAARDGLKKPFPKKAAAKISIDFGSGDSYDF